MLVCWGSASLQEELGLGLGGAAGSVVGTLEGMEIGLLRVLAAQAPLEDWVLDLKMMICRKSKKKKKRRRILYLYNHTQHTVHKEALCISPVLEEQ